MWVSLSCPHSAAVPPLESMATQDEEYLPAYEQDFRAGREIPKYVQEAKARAWERDFAWQIGYSLLPKHPAMTGEYKCWLCIKEPQPREGEEKANPFTFEVETRRGDDLLLSYEEREAARKAGKKIENKVRT